VKRNISLKSKPNHSGTLSEIKCNQNHSSASCINAKLVPVHFEFNDPKAVTVCVAGTFNQWQPGAGTLRSFGACHWRQETFLAPGDYEYCFVVDGQWMPDPRARESVPNPFGGRNSFLTVANSPAAAHRADAETIPLVNDRFNESIAGDHLIAGENVPEKDATEET